MGILVSLQNRFFFVRRSCSRIAESAASSVFTFLSRSTVPPAEDHPRQFVTFPCHCQRHIKKKPDQRTMEEQQEQGSKLLFTKLTEHASAPSKGSKHAAGYDLKSAYDVVVPKRGSALVKTDIQVQLPRGTYGRVAPRSGLALKNKIDVGAGVIDEDYRGNVGVILFNHADEDFSIVKGDRIAQLICQKILYPEVVEVENLDTTERGADGFGSTGVKRAKMEVEEETTAAAGEIKVSPAKTQPMETDVTVVSPTKKQPMEADKGVLSPSKKQPTAADEGALSPSKKPVAMDVNVVSPTKKQAVAAEDGGSTKEQPTAPVE